MIKNKLSKVLDSYIYGLWMPKNYQILLRWIKDFMVKICLNLAYSVSKLGKFSSNLINELWKTLKRVFYYLQRTKNFDFCYTSASNLLNFLA